MLGAAAAATVPETPDRSPTVRTSTLRQVARGVWVVPDDDLIPYVPNVGIVEGTKAILVIDTGLGTRNGVAVRRLAQRMARGRRVILTTTHFHPEHALGASAFDGDYITSVAQAAEIREKAQGLGELFRTLSPGARKALAGFAVRLPNRTYRGERQLDLGGRFVTLREMPAHTRGDQIVVVPDVETIFTGDLVEEASFPVLFDADAGGARWIAVLKRLTAMRPRIVVPGHGHVGPAALIGPQLAYLGRAKTLVDDAVRAGESQAEATRRLRPILGSLHPTWQFKDLIPREIAILYAEASGQPARMPR